MKILAFETSCDDTAVAIVEDGCQVLSSVRVSQVEHAAWGGVVPEIAARLHAEAWRPVLEQALTEAGLRMEDIDYLACTNGPGLQTSLLTGTTVASLLSQLYNIPLLPVHHVYGHLCSVFLEREDLAALVAGPPSGAYGDPAGRPQQGESVWPALVLTASGGHTELYLWKNTTTWQKLGGSLDDAVGEAFDKTAKLLGLGYPGGPVVSQRAMTGDRHKYQLPVPQLGKGSLDFSFSGVKAAVRRLVEQQPAIDEAFINDLCASFEYTVGQIFTKKLKIALEPYPGVKVFYFVGGVSANKYLKQILSDFLQPYGVRVRTPVKIEYSTDNAAMIASAAYWQIRKNSSQAKVHFIEADPRLSLN